MPISGKENERARLMWQCRRGMRELDILLQDFMNERYDDLPLTDQESFRAILALPDQLLLEYLLGRIIPSDPAVAHVITRIRQFPED